MNALSKPLSTSDASASQVPLRRSRILYVTSELADYVKTGGLGEVSAALPRILQEHYDIRVLIPGYPQVLAAHPDMPVVGRLPKARDIPRCDIGEAVTADGLVIYVLICPELFERAGNPYGDTSGADWADNDVRFARLALAAADIASGRAHLSWRPELLHVHDWQAAMAPAYLAWRGSDVPTVLTIHNLAYQGVFDRDRLPGLAIPDSAYRPEGIEFYGRLSFLKAGLFYADHLTTVSTTYAREITTPEFGCGLDGLLRMRAAQGRLSGILNGIDSSWNPRTDPHLLDHFEADQWKGKIANADGVRQTFGLSVARGPLFAIVSRLVHQKGLDVAIEAAEAVVHKGGQIVVTGQGERSVEDAWTRLARKHPGSIGVKIGFEETEARRMFAGSDFLLMPSRFEPCGLSQMYAQRFGSLPIAHKTGGLADTIEDGETGFLFKNVSVPSLIGAVGRAFDTYSSPHKINAMRRAAMARKSGWKHSARTYRMIFHKALASHANGHANGAFR
ncbi:MAG TPA: glycogen synthase GlgA [Alphaproteobacteria bacterium]|jgi:starch synthase